MDNGSQTVPGAELELQVVLTASDLWAAQLNAVRDESFLVRYLGGRVIGGILLLLTPLFLLLPPWTLEAKLVEIGVAAIFWPFLIFFSRWFTRRQFEVQCSKPESAGALGEKTLSFTGDGLWCTDFEGEYLMPWSSAKVDSTEDHIFFSRLPMTVIVPRRFLDEPMEARIQSLLDRADEGLAARAPQTRDVDAAWVSHTCSTDDANELAAREVARAVKLAGLGRRQMFVGAGVGTLVFWAAGGFSLWLIPCMTIGAVATALVMPVISRGATREWRKMTSKAILQQGPKEVAVGLSPERLLVRRDALIERYRWSAIDQISVEPDRFALRLPNGFEIAVPLRAFPDHQSVIDFETTARRFMAAAQDSAA